MLQLKKPSGFTIIEVMVAMTLGLFLLTGLISIGSTITQNQKIFSARENVVYSGSHALKTVADTLKYNDFEGCKVKEIDIAESAFGPAKNTVSTEIVGPSNNDFPISNLATESFLVYDYVGNYPKPTPPTLIKNALDNLDPKPRKNSSVIVSYSVSQESLLTTAAMSNLSDSITIAGNSIGLSQNNYAYITDCFNAAIFRINNDPTTSIAHAPFKTKYSANASVHHVQLDIIYVGAAGYNDMSGNPVYSLYINRNGVRREVAEGVNLMKVQVRMASGIDGSQQYRYPKDAAFDISGANGVRVGLMVTSLAAPLFAKDTKSYTLLGETFGPTDLSGEFATRNYKQVFTTAVLLRNRGL